MLAKYKKIEKKRTERKEEIASKRVKLDKLYILSSVSFVTSDIEVLFSFSS